MACDVLETRQLPCENKDAFGEQLADAVKAKALIWRITMRIDRVTLTGADDSVTPEAMLALSHDYPEIEWGILFSRSREGSPRYPSWDWVYRFCEVASRHNLRCSAHLCGSYVRDIVEEGMLSWFANVCITRAFQRVQFNFRPSKTTPRAEFYDMLTGFPSKHVVLQMDDGPNPILEECRRRGLPVSPLFDLSGGRGVTPGMWPKPLEGLCCGYAGGLTPLNLPEQLRHIRDVAGDATIWIDAESGLRSGGGGQFDLRKAQSFLEAARWFQKERGENPGGFIPERERSE